MTYRKFQVYFFVTLIVLALVLTVLIFQPLLSAIALGFVFAVVSHPLYDELLRVTKNKKRLSALLVALLTVLIVVVPLFVLGALVFNEATHLYARIVADGNGVDGFFSSTKIRLQNLIPGVDINFRQYLEEGLRFFVNQIGAVFSGIANGALTLLLSFLSLYYFLKDGERFKKFIASFSPLEDEYDSQIFSRLALAVKSIVAGYLIVAVIQGILAGIGFSLFGVPSAAFWGAVTVIAALVPMVGTGLVVGPAVLYLLVTGNFMGGIGLLIWGACAVGLVDNLLAPLLIERKMNIHPLLILLSVLGGLFFPPFGVMGFVLGPLTLSLLLALIDIYQNEFKRYFEETTG